MKTITKKLQLIAMCGAIAACTPAIARNAPARMLAPPRAHQITQLIAHNALYNPQAQIFHLHPPQKNMALVFNNLRWNIYAYAAVDVVFASLHRRNQSKAFHAVNTVRTSILGGLKEIVLRMLWDLDQKKSAIALHLFLQNVCWFNKHPNHNSLNIAHVESAFKTFIPPLLIFVQNIRRSC